MRRAAALTMALVLLPASTAFGEDLDQLLERSKDASYSAEQVITCSTPYGVEDAVVRLRQSGGELHVGGPVNSDVSVASGYGGWTLRQGEDVVSSTSLESTGDDADLRYTLDAGTAVEFLGRMATSYQMFDGSLLRAELVTDDEIGALLRVVTYGSDGRVYCERRFISLDPTSPAIANVTDSGGAKLPSVTSAGSLPEELAGFSRLDLYADEDGFVFGYYSDGFFSFAVFETPSLVKLQNPSSLSFDGSTYSREFSPGQVTYSWESALGGMALIGDLPPDMHELVLEGLPEPDMPGFFRRLWRSIFG